MWVSGEVGEEDNLVVALEGINRESPIIDWCEAEALGSMYCGRPKSVTRDY